MEIRAIGQEDAWWPVVAQYADACSWRAGKSLAERMRAMRFTGWETVFVASDRQRIAGFCTLMKTDCIPDVPYTPYIGFVFVGEPYPGHRLSGQLIAVALRHARALGFATVYLVSDHVNLYEKYGFEKVDEKLAPWGAMETIYMRQTGSEDIDM